MLCSRMGLFGAPALVLVLAQVSNDCGRERVALNTFRMHHGPIRDRLDRHDGTATSTNWSGYAVEGTDFTHGTGSWIQPAVTCGSGEELLALWVGIDGYSDATVEQTGTLAGCIFGTPTYLAWYEFYPQEDIRPIPAMRVSPGDKFSSSVRFRDGDFVLQITNETTGATFAKRMASSGQRRSSAEWIAEAPCCTVGGVPYPIPDFGTALLGSDSTGVTATNNATDSAHSGGFGTFQGAQIVAITMAKDRVTESVPSRPSPDGTSFSVKWEAH